MDKIIILKMLPSKDIEISIDNGNTITVPKDNRSITADDIYRLIDFSRGDHFTVESQNEENADVKVLKFFEELLSDIAKKLNQIAASDGDEYITSTETE